MKHLKIKEEYIKSKEMPFFANMVMNKCIQSILEYLVNTIKILYYKKYKDNPNFSEDEEWEINIEEFYYIDGFNLTKIFVDCADNVYFHFEKEDYFEDYTFDKMKYDEIVDICNIVETIYRKSDEIKY